MAISSWGPEALLGQSESDSIGTRMKNPPSLIREGVTPSSQETQGPSEAKSVAQLGIEVRQRRPERAVLVAVLHAVVQHDHDLTERAGAVPGSDTQLAEEIRLASTAFLHLTACRNPSAWRNGRW